jgi:hypothetical protein
MENVALSQRNERLEMELMQAQRKLAKMETDMLVMTKEKGAAGPLDPEKSDAAKPMKPKRLPSEGQRRLARAETKPKERQKPPPQQEVPSKTQVTSTATCIIDTDCQLVLKNYMIVKELMKHSQ